MGEPGATCCGGEKPSNWADDFGRHAFTHFRRACLLKKSRVAEHLWSPEASSGEAEQARGPSEFFQQSDSSDGHDGTFRGPACFDLEFRESAQDGQCRGAPSASFLGASLSQNCPAAKGGPGEAVLKKPSKNASRDVHCLRKFRGLHSTRPRC